MGRAFLFGACKGTGVPFGRAYRKGKPGSTASGWGVKFDDSGQNILAETFIMQWRGRKLVTVYPEGPAVMARLLEAPFSK